MTSTPRPLPDAVPEAEVFCHLVVDVVSDKGAEEVVAVEVGPVLGLVDWFVICNGRNERHVRALLDDLERKVRELTGRRPLRVEGREHLRWVLVDYGDVVVHLFDPETRSYYELERLWTDMRRIVPEGSSAEEGGARRPARSVDG
ncbi:MAG: ribosomal silencing factor RsfS [Acidimicrobiales bacterium]|nr:MAG: ribosomal silencing factor RsfS [Acidimicrobiales bacterium]